MKNDDVEILEKTQAYSGYFQIDRYRLRHPLYEGGQSAPLMREVFERGHTVAVLPYDPDRQEIVLTEQFRIGAYAAGFPAWEIECVAGIIGEGESLEDVARRETLEETGCTVQALHPMCRYLATPGGSTESVQLYMARTDASQAGGFHGLAHEGEDIRAFTLPVDQIGPTLADGKITNGATLIALQWFLLHKDQVTALLDQSA